METVVKEVAKGIWTFPIPLPNNPLKWLNCYVVKGHEGERDLLIDTGFDREECHKALDEGMSQLGLDIENTDVLITHFHTDHSGNAARLQRMGARVFMGSIEYECFKISENGGWERGRDVFCSEGLPEEVFYAMKNQDKSVMYSSGEFPVETIEEGDVLSYGDYKFECILTPGHTPGQMCLFDHASGIMFTADHVLFDITPNIGPAHDRQDNLGTYMRSLEKLKNYDISLALPAHRNVSGMTVYERVDRLIAHHERRIEETEKIIKNFPGSTAYEIASNMHWKIHARNWDEFPVTQKWFALSEAIAHIDYLIAHGRVEKKIEENRIIYF